MKKVRGKPIVVLTLAAVGGLASATPSAHHSFAMYDQSIKYVFTGVVERINPDAAHLQIAFVPLNEKRDALVRDSTGKPATWLVEMGGSAASAREGITIIATRPSSSARTAGARRSRLERRSTTPCVICTIARGRASGNSISRRA